MVDCWKYTDGQWQVDPDCEPLWMTGPLVGRLTHRDFAWYWHSIDRHLTHTERMHMRRNDTPKEFRRQFARVTDAVRHPERLHVLSLRDHLASIKRADHLLCIQRATAPPERKRELDAAITWLSGIFNYMQSLAEKMS